ncbi:MAG: uracil-DNA glycosylase [Clostridia bacterium]|nr:uracil-DNA glycosylase [Clostridia bacterium]
MNDKWSDLENECKGCLSCQLCQTRHSVVFGMGRTDSEVLFVGEGPGQTEDETGLPFVGRAGQLLDKIMSGVGMYRKDIYITNIVKCRPPQNRDPRPEEQQQCMKWLDRQIEIMHPRIIVCLGRISAQVLIKPDFRVTKEHGVFIKKDDILMMGTFHPSALLRNPGNRPLCFEDFRLLRDKINELCTRSIIADITAQPEN